MLSKIALISIHPEHVEKIISKQKRLEFRRAWAVHPLEYLLIYSTFPAKHLAALAKIERKITGSPQKLWREAKRIGGGISREDLYKYLEGKTEAVALELSEVQSFNGGLNPSVIFRPKFLPPQSFRYLRRHEETALRKIVKI